MKNIRMQELALKAGMLYVDNETPQYYFIDVNADIDDLQKFAELLLQDVLDICTEGSKTQTTSEGVAILVRQRFGLDV
jgi:hypothetical protein